MASQKTVGDIRPWLVLLASSLGIFLVGLDVTIINLALPNIQRDFDVSLVEATWVINAYTLTFAALVVVGGKLGDIFGRRRLLLMGFMVFALGSLLGALAPNVYALHAARVVQGMGSAMMMPGTLSILTEAFQRKGLSLAIGIWGGIGALGLMVGPIASGGFTSLFTWRAIFYLNLPIVAAAMLITLLVVRESWDTTIDRRIDNLGVVLSAGAVTVLVLAIMGGNIYGWTSFQTLAIFFGAGLLIVFFALVEVRVPFPIIEPSFFRNRAFAVGAAVRFAAGFSYVPVILMSTIYLQNFLHKSAFEAGLLFLPVAATTMAVTPFWGKIVDHFGPRIPMVLGMAMTGMGALLWLRFDANSGYLDLLPSLFLAGLGGAAAFVTTTAVIMQSLGVNKAGIASGMVNMMQNVAAALGVACVSAVFLNSLRSGLAQRAPGVDHQRVQAFGPDVGSIAQAEAFANALSTAALVVIAVLFLGAVVALFLPKGPITAPKQ